MIQAYLLMCCCCIYSTDYCEGLYIYTSLKVYEAQVKIRVAPDLTFKSSRSRIWLKLVFGSQNNTPVIKLMVSTMLSAAIEAVQFRASFFVLLFASLWKNCRMAMVFFIFRPYFLYQNTSIVRQLHGSVGLMHGRYHLPTERSKLAHHVVCAVMALGL